VSEIIEFIEIAGAMVGVAAAAVLAVAFFGGTIASVSKA
jgi:hypothetical protein